MPVKESITEKVKTIISDSIIELGFNIWDIEFNKIGQNKYLIITIDNDANNVDIDSCESVHNVVSSLLDEYDPIEESYYLQISSPGLERNIRTKEHYIKCINQKIKISLFTAKNSLKDYIGILDYDDKNDTVFIKDDNNNILISVERKEISKANTYYDFGSEGV